jgi:hypothetical protein
MSVSSQLKIIMTDVFNGYTKMYSPRFKDIYIQHVDAQISYEVEVVKERFSDKAIKEGLLTSSQKLAYLEETKQWTSKEESNLDSQNSFLKGLIATRAKCFLRAEKQQLSNTITGQQKVVEDLEQTKHELIGLTVENYALRKSNQFYVVHSSFKNPSLSDKLFPNSFEDLEDEDLIDLMYIFNKYTGVYTSRNLKQVAVSSSFLNYFCLCEDNPFYFYGKPIVSLTFNQVELFGYGRYYRSILSEHGGNIPEDILSDPDKLVDWHDSRKNAEEALSRAGGNQDDKNVSLVGATKEDLRDLGIDGGGRNINLAEEAKKRGVSSFSMDELIKLQYGE